jgi:peroxiredoxin
MHKKYAARGFTVVSVSNDDTAKEAGNFARQTKATFPVVHDPKGSIFTKYGVSPIPANLVIDRKGKIVFAGEGADIPALQAAVARAVAAK